MGLHTSLPIIERKQMNKLAGYKGQRLKRPYYGGGRQKLNLEGEELRQHNLELRRNRDKKKQEELYLNTVEQIVKEYKKEAGLNEELNPLITRKIASDLVNDIRIIKRQS